MEQIYRKSKMWQN